MQWQQVKGLPGKEDFVKFEYRGFYNMKNYLLISASYYKKTQILTKSLSMLEM